MTDDPEKEFQSHLFFLRHFAHLVWAERAARGDADGLVARLLDDQVPLLGAVQPIPVLDEAQRRRLRKYLFAAWNGETLAQLSQLHPPELRRFTNQWKPVQAYYAVYFQLVALQFTQTAAPPHTHSAAVNYGTSSVVPRLPIPWRLRLDYDAMKSEHFPSPVNLKPAPGWNLANTDPYEYVGNFLRVTGERSQHDTWVREYKGKKKKLIQTGPRAGKRYRIRDVPVGLVSFFDVMWRFRMWANYREADTIIEGGEYEDWVIEFDQLYGEILEATATVLEHIVCRRVGRKTLHGLYADYLGYTKGTLDCRAIERRQDIICSVVL